MDLIRLFSLNPRNPIVNRLYIGKLQNKINLNNRKRLINASPTLVCSNCTGGFLYHWLGLRFNSPFINLFLWPKDFVCALENWEEFISSEITEVASDTYYPVGQIITQGGGSSHTLYAL